MNENQTILLTVVTLVSIWYIFLKKPTTSAKDDPKDDPNPELTVYQPLEKLLEEKPRPRVKKYPETETGREELEHYQKLATKHLGMDLDHFVTLHVPEDVGPGPPTYAFLVQYIGEHHKEISVREARYIAHQKYMHGPNVDVNKIPLGSVEGVVVHSHQQVTGALTNPRERAIHRETLERHAGLRRWYARRRKEEEDEDYE